jgi:hypothetical protein
MHFLNSLIIFSGFVFIFCLGIVKLIWDLPEMSLHGPPDMSATAHGGTSQAEEGLIATAENESIAAESE